MKIGIPSTICGHHKVILLEHHPFTNGVGYLGLLQAIPSMEYPLHLSIVDGRARMRDYSRIPCSKHTTSPPDCVQLEEDPYGSDCPKLLGGRRCEGRVCSRRPKVFSYQQSSVNPGRMRVFRACWKHIVLDANEGCYDFIFSSHALERHAKASTAPH